MRQANALFARWQAEQERWEVRFAALRLPYMNVNRDRDLHPAPFTLDEVLGRAPASNGKITRRQTAADQKRIMRSYSVLMGGSNGR